MGFKLEGCCKNAVFREGEFLDDLIMALLV
jgi:hypothetical protein